MLIIGSQEPIIAGFSTPLKASHIVSGIKQTRNCNYIYYYIEAVSPTIKGLMLKPY